MGILLDTTIFGRMQGKTEVPHGAGNLHQPMSGGELIVRISSAHPHQEVNQRLPHEWNSTILFHLRSNGGHNGQNELQLGRLIVSTQAHRNLRSLRRRGAPTFFDPPGGNSRVVLMHEKRCMCITGTAKGYESDLTDKPSEIYSRDSKMPQRHAAHSNVA